VSGRRRGIHASVHILAIMTVGHYADVELQDAADTWRHGAVFLLRKAALRDAVVSLDGWTTTVVNGVKAVKVRGPSSTRNFGGTFAEALAAANNGLDFMCASGMAHCVVVKPQDESLVWWPQRGDAGVAIRATVIQTFQAQLSATVVVRNSAGNIVPSAPLAPKIHDAFRYLRMCKTSEDLLDSYRNLFLAFERLLSDIRPRKRRSSTLRPLLRLKPDGRWETEKHWFMDALGEAEQLVLLDRLTPPQVRNHKKWIHKTMYGRQRSALMPAKLGQNYLLPQDEASRADLIVSLGRLWDYINELIYQHHGVRSGGGGLFGPGWAMVVDPWLSSLVPFVSDDESPFNPAAASLVAEGSTIVELQSAAPAARTVAWLRGEFASAQAQHELATADLAMVDERGLKAVWYLPNEPRALARREHNCDHDDACSTWPSLRVSHD
jgi:hypothetical protein